MNKELVNKNVRVVAYRPMEIEMLINNIDNNGLDNFGKEKLSNILSKIKDYPYAYELVTLWAVYNIDNLNEPIYYIYVNGINSQETAYLEFIENKNYKYDLIEKVINQSIELILEGLLKNKNITNVNILDDGNKIIECYKKNNKRIVIKNNYMVFNKTNRKMMLFKSLNVALALPITVFITILLISLYTNIYDNFLAGLFGFLGSFFLISCFIVELVSIILTIINFVNIGKVKKDKNFRLYLSLNIVGIVIRFLIIILSLLAFGGFFVTW